MRVDAVTFLSALGLDRDADERAVRRAYAQRLKHVDQERDPEGFQALRTNYEHSLRWVKRQAQSRAEHVSQTPEQVPDIGAPQAPVPEPMATDAPTFSSEATAAWASGAERAAPPDPHRAADEVFAAFLELARADAGFVDETAARAALDLALNDDRLVNLEARTLFERRIASLLMEGWRPGHEYLFGPACEVFHWDQDRRHLALFGSLGAALDAAIEQKLIFLRQPPGAFEVQRKLIRRLREAQMPSARTLGDEMPLLQTLLQRYPQWLRIVTSRDNINAWHRAYETLPPKEQTTIAAEPAPRFRPTATFEPRKNSRMPGWLVAILMVGVLGTIGRLGSSGNSARYTLPPTSSQGSGGPSASDGWMPLPSATKFVAPAATEPRTEQLKVRQREVDAAMKRVLEERRTDGRGDVRPSAPPPPPKPKLASTLLHGVRPEEPSNLVEPDTSAPQRSGPSTYELLRAPDGSASSPRLGF